MTMSALHSTEALHSSQITALSSLQPHLQHLLMSRQPALPFLASLFMHCPVWKSLQAEACH